jgi:hypothetical protein
MARLYCVVKERWLISRDIFQPISGIDASWDMMAHSQTNVDGLLIVGTLQTSDGASLDGHFAIK